MTILMRLTHVNTIVRILPVVTPLLYLRCTINWVFSRWNISRCGRRVKSSTANLWDRQLHFVTSSTSTSSPHIPLLPHLIYLYFLTSYTSTSSPHIPLLPHLIDLYFLTPSTSTSSTELKSYIILFTQISQAMQRIKFLKIIWLLWILDNENERQIDDVFSMMNIFTIKSSSCSPPNRCGTKLNILKNFLLYFGCAKCSIKFNRHILKIVLLLWLRISRYQGPLSQILPLSPLL